MPELPVLLNQGYRITGSDLKPSAAIDRLKNMGARIYLGHEAANVARADVVVYDPSAINMRNRK